ncbi:nucleotide exchange factor GrpE [Neisseria sp. Ec49-e6-T10]|uniref:nucleotide exchange factor GrpE n=1 Tax=Neisseria sp. Ec49-e6-T10 TaxID=3140744 RepID=UPI003EB958A3
MSEELEKENLAQEQTSEVDEAIKSAEPQQAEVGDESVQEEVSLEQKIADLEAQLAEQKDLVLRTRAESENTRRRAQEDVQAAHKFAINKFVSELLPVKDSLEMALADQSGQFDALKFGVDLTLKQLQSAFDKVNIQEINPMGEKLDPHLHQALNTEETNEVEPNTVVKVMQKGYKVAERVVRPALVVVSKEKSE